VTDLNGDVIAGLQVKTEMWRGREAVIQRCFDLVRETLARAQVNFADSHGIGVAFSGVIDVQCGRILSYPRLGQVEQWRNVPLKKIVEDEFGVPSLLEDSVRAVVGPHPTASVQTHSIHLPPSPARAAQPYESISPIFAQDCF
jgi:N-acetylglucosamine repressor